MASFLWVTLGSALGGLLRYTIMRLTLPFHTALPWSTLAINVLGSFAISCFGMFTLPETRHAAPENLRLFVMVGICGGFTTFSAFSLETFSLLQAGAWGRALLNAGLSVVLCVGAVALGHVLVKHGHMQAAVVRTGGAKFSG